MVESWLDDTILDSEISIQGYSLCRLDRTRHGGGVLIYVFTSTVIFKGSAGFECIVLSVFCNCSHSPAFTVALLYRPPSFGHAPLDNLFSTFCNLFVNFSSHLYLIGDFNIDFLTPTAPLYISLCLLCHPLTLLKL